MVGNPFLSRNFITGGFNYKHCTDDTIRHFLPYCSTLSLQAKVHYRHSVRPSVYTDELRQSLFFERMVSGRAYFIITL